LNRVEFLFSPDLFIVGGGVSRSTKFLPLLNVKAEIVPAQLFNDRNCGAALAARLLVR
jgi:polyphosphate glucokinase